MLPVDMSDVRLFSRAPTSQRLLDGGGEIFTLTARSGFPKVFHEVIHLSRFEI
jgi:hypothetical protein